MEKQKTIKDRGRYKSNITIEFSIVIINHPQNLIHLLLNHCIDPENQLEIFTLY
jgi:hypothetical protein